jgi:hypothetical protein
MIGDDATLQKWDLIANRIEPLISDGPSLTAASLAVDDRGLFFAANTTPRTAGILDISRREFVFRLAEERAAIGSLCWSPRGVRLAAGLSDGSVAVWNLDQIRRQLKAAGLAAGVRAFGSGQATGLPEEPMMPREQHWQLIDQATLIQRRARQILAGWDIPAALPSDEPVALPDDRNERGETLELADRLRHQIDAADGFAGASGAFVLTLSASEFPSLNRGLGVAGYSP